ncbi:MAG: thioredoxin domain-containing protein [Pseudomonadota bacterium]
MRRIHVLAAVLSLALVACHATTSSNGNTAPKVNNSAERKDKVLANLKARYPQLATLNPELGDFTSAANGMDQVEMNINTPRGPQKQLLLLTPDDKALYMVVEGPIDVSRSPADLASENAKKRAEKQAALAGLIQGQPVRGKADAPVTIIEFSDYQCPFCKRGYETAEQVLAKHADKVKLVFLPYPLPFHPWARPASIATHCAAQQKPEAHWALYDAYFKNQGDLTPENVQDKTLVYLDGSGLDMNAFKACFTDEASASHKAAVGFVDRMMEEGGKQGVDGTPAFFINGELLSGAQPVEAFEQAIQQALGTQG